MNCFRNILLFVSCAMIIAGCGGGNTTIAANDTNSNTTSNPNNTTPSSTSTGTTTLHWTAPTTLADTTPASLSDISGYRLYYGPSATNTPNAVNISSGTVTQYTISLPSGTYYFRIAAIDSNGYEGLESSALKVTL